MYYEEVVMKDTDTLSGLAAEYGYKVSDWRKIWDDPKNAALVKKRTKPEHLQKGDTWQIPIPWKTTRRVLTADPNGATFIVNRDGEPGKRLSWVQTVYRSNQPIGPNPSPYCVDGCTPDDNLPFYWTNGEVASPPAWTARTTGDPKVNLRKTFIDHSSRNAPSVWMGTTKWRAVVSIAVVTEKRVTVVDSYVWGFDLTPASLTLVGVAITPPSTCTAVGPTPASAGEISAHVNLLGKGWGTLAAAFAQAHLNAFVPTATFGAMGWTFRKPPS
ncbi:MAG TPA: hypothetical protein VGL53_23615 [Bryobacteraceae bacterium]|jgi:hypothetical protein